MLRDCCRESYEELVRPQAAANDATAFEFKAPESGEFFVYRHQNHSRKDICFRLNGNKIAVFEADSSGETLQFTVTVALNDAGECRFHIARPENGTDEKGYLCWQVLRYALQDLLFARTNR